MPMGVVGGLRGDGEGEYCRFRTADSDIASGEQRHIVQPANGLCRFLSESSTYLNLPPKQ